MGDHAALQVLARTCATLNFEHSLAHDAAELRAGVVAALERAAQVLDGVAISLGRRAQCCAPGTERDRLLAAVARARERAAAGRSRADEFAGRSISPSRSADAA
jgi:hypothetical protein